MQLIENTVLHGENGESWGWGAWKCHDAPIKADINKVTRINIQSLHAFLLSFDSLCGLRIPETNSRGKWLH